MADDRAELKREFEITRRELAEMAEDITIAEARMAVLGRHDLQVTDLRDMLDDARCRLADLVERERAVRAQFCDLLGDIPDRTH